MKAGVKALLLRTKEGDYVMGLVAADRRMDFKKLARIVGTKKLRLASLKEVLKETRCEVGSVHPFGNIHGIPTYFDISILESDIVNFNAGLQIVSIQMKSKDLINATKPRIEDFSKS